jgi:hypothetical protein
MLRYVLHADKNSIKWLLKVHQGWFECIFPYFPPLLGVAVVTLAFTGLQQLSIDNKVSKSV